MLSSPLPYPHQQPRQVGGEQHEGEQGREGRDLHTQEQRHTQQCSKVSAAAEWSRKRRRNEGQLSNVN